jgi:hypothetical protein
VRRQRAHVPHNDGQTYHQATAVIETLKEVTNGDAFITSWTLASTRCSRFSITGSMLPPADQLWRLGHHGFSPGCHMLEMNFLNDELKVPRVKVQFR